MAPAPPRRKRRVRPRVDRLVLRIARREGLVPKAARADVRGVCAEHAFVALAFSSPIALSTFLDELARQRQRGGVQVQRVQLPDWKLPPNVRSAVAVRHRACGGRGCDRCGVGCGWWIRVVLRVPRKAAA